MNHRTITDEVIPGTRVESQSIADAEPDVYTFGTTSEEYTAWAKQVREDESLSAGERADILASAPVPSETYEERLEREV